MSIPSKAPGVFVSITDLNTASSTGQVVCLAIGIKLPTGTAVVGEPVQIFSVDQGVALGGEGSQLAAMIRTFLGQASGVPLVAVAVLAPVGAAASKTFTLAGTTTTANPILIQVEDETIDVALPIGADQDAVAAAIDAELALAAYDSLHVDAAAALAVVTWTVKSHGVQGDGVSVKVLELPPGITVVETAMAGGAGAADVDSALSGLGDVRYNYLILPDADGTNLADVKTFLDARWAADAQIDGQAFVGKRDTVGNLATLGLGLDDKHLSIIGDPNVPTSPWNQAAAAAAARGEKTNPILSIRDVPLSQVVAPPATVRLTVDEQDQLLKAGIAVYWYVQGVPRISRLPTLAKTNDIALASDALYDIETKLTVSAIRQEMLIALTPEIGKVLVDDSSAVLYDFEVASNVTDVARVRTILENQYVGDFVPAGWVGDVDGFNADLVVTKTSPNSISYVAKPRVNGTLYTIIGSLQFQLNG